VNDRVAGARGGGCRTEPPPSIGPLRRQELTDAWRVMEKAGRPPSPRARSVIQGVVERRLRPYLFGSLVFSSHVLQAKTFGLGNHSATRWRRPYS
jgi:hypothetical protein